MHRALPIAVRVLCVLSVAALSCAATAQRRDGSADAKWRTDPYTHNDPDAMRAAGYVSFGPFTWGDRHDTIRIEEDLGEILVIWIETAHFKIGSSLPSKMVPRDRQERGKIKAELTRLRAKLPEIKPGARRLDPWLRAHLFAMRLEELYAEVQELLGVTDARFPAQPERDGASANATDPAAAKDTANAADAPDASDAARGAGANAGAALGRGPFLGMRGKFLVLLCEKQSTCSRYVTTFPKTDPSGPSRWFFEATDCFFFGTAEEYGEGAFQSDTAMHAHVVFNVAHCLLDAFGGYRYLVPSWWKEGLCHVLRRRVSDRHNNFSRIQEDPSRAYQVHDWDVKVRQRLGYELVRPLEELLPTIECEGWTLVDHMACWSRVEFLLQRDREAFARFVTQMKDLADENGVAPATDVLLERQQAAIRELLGFDDADALDAAWGAWAKKTYRGRKQP